MSPASPVDLSSLPFAVFSLKIIKKALCNFLIPSGTVNRDSMRCPCRKLQEKVFDGEMLLRLWNTHVRNAKKIGK